VSRHPTEAATGLTDTRLLPCSDTERLLPAPGTPMLPPSPAGPGRHRDAETELGWLRQWGVSLVSGAVILATVLTVATVLLVTHDDEPSTGPEIQTATGSEPQPADPTAEPTPSPTVTPTASPGPTRTTPAAPMDRIVAFAAEVQRQINTANLDPEAGRGLLQGLSDAARRLNRGHHRKAVERLAQLEDRLAELRRDGKLTPAGFAALDYLDSIIDSIRDADGGRR
jgi:hypothetical protein